MISPFTILRRAAAYPRPTLSIPAARTFLEEDEDGILPLIEEGALVAWNIALPGADRRELRILLASLVEFLNVANTGRSGYRCNLSRSAAVSLLVDELDRRHQVPRLWFSGTEIRRALNCCSTHVINLIEARQLKLLPKTDYSRGPNGSPCVARDSFLDFLNRRFA